MPTLVITLDGRELQRLPLTQGRTTIGRRPYNDIVMEHLAVSGEHAVFVLHPDGRVQVLDLNSTNGTYVNGRAVVSADIGPDDRIQIARYELQVLPGEAGQVAVASPAATPPPTPAPAQAAPLRAAADEPAPVVRVGPPATSGRGGSESAPPPDAAPLPRAAAVSVATLVVVDGPSAGRAMPLHKPLTTVGRPGVTVAAVLRTAEGHAVRQSDGTEPVLLNGVPIGDQAQPLHAGDVLTVAGTRIRYVTDA